MKISDMYFSWQGTGGLSGIRQLFVRTAGCHLHCPIRKVCDQPVALDFTGDDYTPEALARHCMELLAGEDVNWVHLTGGEPLHYSEEVSAFYCELLRLSHHKVKMQLQTSGLVPLFELKPYHTRAESRNNLYVTLSPKSVESLKAFEADELIVVADSWVTPDSLTVLERLIKVNGERYIQPLCVEGKFTDNWRDLALTSGWRVTGQLHKQWSVK